jgi:hypothetical protein
MITSALLAIACKRISAMSWKSVAQGDLGLVVEVDRRRANNFERGLVVR